MHYLCVLNHVQLPQEDSSPEAIESTLVLSSCIRGMMSLIVMATLTPECGNPLHSTHLHTHRHKDITFVGSRCVCVCVCVCVRVCVCLCVHSCMCILTCFNVVLTYIQHTHVMSHCCRLGRKLSYLMKVLEDSQSAVSSLVKNSISPASGLYDRSLERLCSALQPGPGQVRRLFVTC